MEKTNLERSRPRKRRSRTMIAAAIALPFLLAAGACGASDGGKATGPSGGTGSEPATVSGLGAGNAEWATLLKEASGQKIKIVTREHPRYDSIVASFRKAFPDIKIEHTSARPSDIAPRVVSEQKNGIYGWDVTIGSTANMIDVLEPAGTLQDLPPLYLLKDLISDAKWGGGFDLYAGAASQVLVTAANNFSYIWVNRDKISEAELGDISQLADPKFKGQFSLGGCDRPAQAAAGMVGLMQLGGEDLVRTILKDQKPTFFDNARDVVENMMRGRYAITVGNDSNHIATLKEAGLKTKVEQLLPAAGTGGNLTTEGIAVFKNAPNQAAATVFLNWFMSKDGQQAYVDANTATEIQNSRQVEIAVQDATVNPEWDNLSKYTSWSTDLGKDKLAKVLDMCVEARK